MKKIININLAGRVIPIEDSAYEKLQGYIESLRRYFAREEGRDEIINDIESRMAELMNEEVRKGATCVTEDHIETIISSMGRPEDFEAEEATEAGTKSQSASQADYTSTTTKKSRGRLYRNMSDRFLGGVCSGIANYFNIDPAIVRFLFAILTFGGFGIGIFLYLLLWIILPARALDGFGGKRLFRNPEDRIISGVGGGLAAYFNKEAWLVRLIFVGPILLNILVSILSGAFFHFEPFPSILFGSLSGTFVLAYIILWIVLPEAKSSYEKMEMRGEKVDVNAIRQNVKEGMQQFKDRASEFGEEIKSSAQNFSAKAKEFAQTKGKNFVSEATQVTKPIGSSIGHAISVIFKAFFLFFAGSIAFVLFVGLMTLIFGGVGLMPFKNFLLDGFWQNLFAWGTLVLFLGVPLVAFITWLVRRMMKVRSQNNYLGWTFAGLWVLGWICVSFLVASIMRDVRSYERVEETMQISQPPNGKMIIQVNEPEIRFSGSFWWFDANPGGWDINDDTLKISNIKIRVLKSEDSIYHTKIYKYSAGRTRTDAENRAAKVQFNTSYQDSILYLGSGLAIGKNSRFRGQQVVVELQVPVGKKLRFDESIADRLHAFTVRLQENHGWRRSWNRRNYNIEFDYDEYFDWDVNVDYTMGSDGKLMDPNKKEDKKLADSTDYRYDSKDRRRIEYEKQKRKLEQEQQKLQKIEDQMKKDSLRAIPRQDNGNGKLKYQGPVIHLLFHWLKYFFKLG